MRFEAQRESYTLGMDDLQRSGLRAVDVDRGLRRQSITD